MRIAVGLIAWLVGAGVALGQEDASPTTRPSVFVRVSVDAGESLRRLAAMEADRQWGQATEGYDRLMAEAGEELVRVDATRYRNVRTVVLGRLRAWPVAARRRYAEQMAARAAAEVGKLSATAPAELWMGLAERYWLTPAGQEAARKAIERLQAEGRAGAAAKWAEWVRVGAGGSEIPDFEAREPWRSGSGERLAYPQGDAWEVVWERPLATLKDGGMDTARAEDKTEISQKAGEATTSQKAGETPAPPVTTLAPQDAAMVLAGERVCVLAGGHIYGLGLGSGRVMWSYAPAVGEEEGEEEEEAAVSGERGGMTLSPSGDVLFANITPVDGKNVGRSVLAGIETNSGQVIWQVEATPRDMSENFRPVEFFDGRPVAYDGRVYVVVRRRRELGFEDCRLACFDPGTGERLWDAWIASGPAVDAGRHPACAEPKAWLGDVFVQTHAGVAACVDGVTGRVQWVVEYQPVVDGPQRQPAEAEPAAGLSVVMEQGTLRCLAPRGKTIALLIGRAVERVDDAEAWLDVSRAALRPEGGFYRGLEALDVAVAIAAGRPATTRVDAEFAAARLRAEALDVLIEAALTRDEDDAREDQGRVVTLWARAAELAGGDEEQVAYRLAFARRLEAMGNVVAAVQLCQEVLDWEGLRGVVLIAPPSLKGWGTLGDGDEAGGNGRDGSGPRTAGRMAERLIDAWIRGHGREVYAESERRARAMAEEGIAKSDGALLKAAMERYPNAEGLGQTLDAWMKLERKAGRQMAAARFAEDLLRRRTDMTAGARVAVTEQIAAARAESRSAWPAVAPPVHKLWELERPEAVLLTPQEQAVWAEDRAGAELVLLFEQGRMEAIDTATGRRLWEAPVVAVGTPVWLGTRGDLLILATPFQLAAVDRRDGAVRWVAGEVPRKAMSSAVDPEILTRFVSVTLGQTLAIVIKSDGHGLGVEISSGEVLWERELAHGAGGALTVDGAYAAYLAPGEPAALVVLAADSGAEVATFPMDELAPVSTCKFIAGGRVLVASGKAIAGYDPAAKTRRWRIETPHLVRAGALLVAGERFYLADENAVAARACADGAVVWNRDLKGEVVGRVLEAWVDGGQVYVLGEGGAADLDARTGEVRGTTAWSGDAVIGSAWLAGGHLLATGVKAVDQAGGTRRWELEAYWARREMGKGERAMIDRLGQFSAAPDVAVCGQSVVVRAGKIIAAWGRIDSQMPDR